MESGGAPPVLVPVFPSLRHRIHRACVFSAGKEGNAEREEIPRPHTLRSWSQKRETAPPQNERELLPFLFYCTNFGTLDEGTPLLLPLQIL